jgi:sarcosine oxidase subunit beta
VVRASKPIRGSSAKGGTDGLLAAAFCPDDGLATPEAVVQGYAAGARRRGAHIETGCEPLDVRLRGEAIEAAVTSKGAVETPALVCAAGAWPRRVGAMVGVDLPVTPYRRQVLVTEAVPGLPERLPMTIDFASSFYFHREGRGLLMGMSLDDEPAGFNLDHDDAWILRLAEVVARRTSSLAEVGEVVRDLFLGRRPPAADRFQRGTGRPELNVV